MKPKSALENIDYKITKFSDAVSVRIPNRRITAFEENGDIFIEAVSIRKDPEPPFYHRFVRGKMHILITRHTRECAESLMIALAKQLGYELCYINEPNPPASE